MDDLGRNMSKPATHIVTGIPSAIGDTAAFDKGDSWQGGKMLKLFLVAFLCVSWGMSQPSPLWAWNEPASPSSPRERMRWCSESTT
jgi:hypothetical protein